MDRWLHSDLRGLRFQERAAFIDLLVLAGDSAFGDIGEIKIQDKKGFPDTHFETILGMKPYQWQDSKKLLCDYEMIKVLPNNIIVIVNWKKYQSEYRRQRGYRRNHKTLRG